MNVDKSLLNSKHEKLCMKGVIQFLSPFRRFLKIKIQTKTQYNKIDGNLNFMLSLKWFPC